MYDAGISVQIVVEFEGNHYPIGGLFAGCDDLVAFMPHGVLSSHQYHRES
jgi:hypothetical protein